MEKVTKPFAWQLLGKNFFLQKSIDNNEIKGRQSKDIIIFTELLPIKQKGFRLFNV